MHVDDGYATDQTPTWHVTVLAPTAILHAPVLAAFPGRDLPIDAVVPCSTVACTATLYYRIPGTSPLAEPAWKTLNMGLVATGTQLGDATTLYQRRATVPAADVTVRGVEYFIRASDGFTTAYSPGSAYIGTQYTSVDGQQTHYFSVHVAEPVRIAHVPVVAAQRDNPINTVARVNCATRNCRATLWYRRSGTPNLSVGVNGVNPTVGLGLPAFEAHPMAGAQISDLGGAGTLIEYTRRIPAAEVTPAGVDYYLQVTDGHTTAYYPGTSYVSGSGSLDGQQAAFQHVTVSGQRLTATIGDRVWFDYDDDGVRDPTDPLEGGAAGIRLDLLHPGLDGAWGTLDDRTLASQVTDDDGYYDFAGLPPGTYRVALVAATIPPGAVLRSPNPLTMTVTAGGDDDTADFLLRHTAVLGGLVYLDEDRNNIANPADPRLGAVTVQLDNPGRDATAGTVDDITLTTTTGADGVYRFTALPTGTYAVTVHHSTVAVGLRLTAPDPLVVTLTPGATSTTNDLPHRHSGRIAGRAVSDDDLDGVWSPLESGAPNVIVRLRTAGPDGTFATGDDVTFRTATTASDGTYALEDLPPGTYQVVVNPADVPSSHNLTSTDPVAVTVAAGQQITGIDFHFQHRGAITGTVYLDDNRDHARNDIEDRLGGLAVMLTSTGVDGQPGTSDDIAVTTTSGSVGDYGFEHLPPGTYRLSVGAGTPPGTAPAPPIPLVVNLAAGATRANTDLAVWWSGHIEVVAWDDLDADDAPGATEPRLANTGVTVTYLGADTQPGGGDDNLVATQLTDGTGTTRVDYLRLGFYRVVIAGRLDHRWEVRP